MHAIQYSFTLWRILYFLIALRIKHPSTLIYFMKYDIDNAFKRLILKLKATLQTIITLGTLAFIFLRSTFGGKSSCSNFSLLAEPMANVMNEALYTNHLQALRG